jgi:hypothetical protein
VHRLAGRHSVSAPSQRLVGAGSVRKGGGARSSGSSTRTSIPSTPVSFRLAFRGSCGPSWSPRCYRKTFAPAVVAFALVVRMFQICEAAVGQPGRAWSGADAVRLPGVHLPSSIERCHVLASAGLTMQLASSASCQVLFPRRHGLPFRFSGSNMAQPSHRAAGRVLGTRDKAARPGHESPGAGLGPTALAGAD